jgi:DUF4097 and DUF4098 domain-containing protein YvlB
MPAKSFRSPAQWRSGRRRTTSLLATFVVLVAAALLLQTPALAAQGQEREVSRSFDARDGMIVELENLAGAVTVEGSSSGQIEIVGTIHADGSGAESLLTQLEITFETSGNRIEVKAKYPVDRYKVYRYPQEGRSRTQIKYQDVKVKVVSRDEDDPVTLYADFHLRLPHGVGADIENYVGNINATGVHGMLSADTGSGDVTASDGVGSLNADTGSGDVRIQNYEGDVSADTGSGDVVVRGVQGDLSADTGSGDVDITDVDGRYLSADTGSGDVTMAGVTGSIEADTGSGDIEIRDLKAGARLMADTGSGSVTMAGDLSQVEEIEIDTGSGSVEIDMSVAPGMRILVETGNGSIDVDLPDLRITRSSKNYFRGESGDGQADVTISTGSGRVSISARG